MDNNNVSLINQLYLVRAFLSTLSQNNTELEELESLRKQCDESKFVPSVFDNGHRLADQLNEEESKLNKLHHDLEQLEEKDKELDLKISKQQESINNDFSYRGNLIFTLIFTAITFVGMFFLGKWWVNTDYSFWVGLLFFPVSIVLLFFDISLWSVSSKKHINEEKRKKDSNLKLLLEEKEEIPDKKATVKKEIANTNANILSIKQNIDLNAIKVKELETAEFEEFCKSKSARLKDYENKQLALVKKASFIDDCVGNITIIDKRDWKNLDLIIYQLETGRADSIKEALQQADLYIRHNEIKAVMQTATLAICSNIKESIGKLSFSIGASFESLRSDVEAMNQTNFAMSSKFDDLISAQDLSNALLKKANVSSERLVEDIDKIKNYFG